jgi:hypothetical protein
MAKAMEGINTEADIMEFITEHSTDETREGKIEFMPY